MVIENLIPSDARLTEIQSLQKQEPICKLLIEFSKNGWANKNNFPN